MYDTLLATVIALECIYAPPPPMYSKTFFSILIFLFNRLVMWIRDALHAVSDGKAKVRVTQASSYQSLISKRVVDTANEKPEGPQVLKPEL